MIHEHVALDDAYSCARKWPIKFLFTFSRIVLIQVIKPVTKFHTGIKIATHVHGCAIVGTRMAVDPGGIVIGSVNVWAVIYVLGHRAPFGTRCSG